MKFDTKTLILLLIITLNLVIYPTMCIHRKKLKDDLNKENKNLKRSNTMASASGVIADKEELKSPDIKDHKIKNMFGNILTCSHKESLKYMNTFFEGYITMGIPVDSAKYPPLRFNLKKTENFRCPMYYIYQAIKYSIIDSFVYLDNLVDANIANAINQKKELKELKIELEPWETYMISIMENLVVKNRNYQFKSGYSPGGFNFMQNIKEEVSKDYFLYKFFKLQYLLDSGNEDKLINMQSLYNYYNTDYNKKLLENKKPNSHEKQLILFYVLNASFIKEEVGEMETSDKLISIGLKIAPTNTWLIHNRVHIMQTEGKHSNAISYLDSIKFNPIDILTKNEDENKYERDSGKFILQHLTWHTAISYLQKAIKSKQSNANAQNNYDNYVKSKGLFKEVVKMHYNNSESFVNIIGFLMRFNYNKYNLLEKYNDKEFSIYNFYNEINISVKNNNNQIVEESVSDHIKSQIIKPERYMKHCLADFLSAWLIGYMNNKNRKSSIENANQNEKEEFNDQFLKILEKVNQNNLLWDTRYAKAEEKYKTFFREEYPEILKTMYKIGNGQINTMYTKLQEFKTKNLFKKIGSSNEQVEIMDFLLEYYTVLHNKNNQKEYHISNSNVSSIESLPGGLNVKVQQNFQPNAKELK